MHRTGLYHYKPRSASVLPLCFLISSYNFIYLWDFFESCRLHSGSNYQTKTYGWIAESPHSAGVDQERSKRPTKIGNSRHYTTTSIKRLSSANITRKQQQQQLMPSLVAYSSGTRETLGWSFYCGLILILQQWLLLLETNQRGKWRPWDSLPVPKVQVLHSQRPREEWWSSEKWGLHCSGDVSCRKRTRDKHEESHKSSIGREHGEDGTKYRGTGETVHRFTKYLLGRGAEW